MFETLSSPIITHRSGLTSADSGNVPASWSDNPSAFTYLNGQKGIRIYPVITGGTISSFTIRPLIDSAGTNPFSAMTITSDYTEPIFLPNMNGYTTFWIKLEDFSTATGTPSFTFKLQAIDTV